MTTTAPLTGTKFLELVDQSGLLDDGALASFRAGHAGPGDSRGLAAEMVKAGLLTPFQARHLLGGRFRGLVLGSYKLLSEIGRGGMGTVYLAEHKSLKRRAAVKVLTAEAPKPPGATGTSASLATERFYREARTAAALSHPNIVRVHDVSRAGNVHYIAMEYVEGKTLAQMVQANGPMHYAQAADYVAQAAAGLQEAHDKGLVHRDIKPDNLIVDKTGTLKILDLGLARRNDCEGDQLTARLEPGAVLGTADYIAPEQALNGAVDIRSDIYSLGVTFFALITGRPPFGGTTAQKLFQHQIKDAPTLASLRAKAPAELGEVIAKMMAKRQADRYQTPADVIDALAPWLSAAAIANGQPSSVAATLTRLTTRQAQAARPPAGVRRKWLWPAVGGVAVTLLTLGGVVAYAVSSGTPPQPALAPRPQAAVIPAPAPTERATPAVPSGPPQTIYRLNLSTVEPFNLTMRARNASEAEAPGTLPSPWVAESLAYGYATEIALLAIDGANTISLRNLEKNARIQFYTANSVAQQTPGSSYTVSIDYRTEGGARGVLEARAGVSGATPGNQKHLLPDTEGQWATAEFVMSPVYATTPLFLFLHGVETTEGNRLSIRSVSVIERGP